MRIAWISPYLPAPENTGGRIRIRRLAEALSHHELELFCRVGPDDPDPASLSSSELGPWSRVHAQRQPHVRHAWRAPKLAYLFPPEVRLSLEAADRVKPFDVAIAEHCFATFDFPRLRHAPLVLNEHNVESDYFRKEFRVTRRPAKLIEFARWWRFERKAWSLADAVTAVTDHDAERIGAVRGQACHVIPNGISMDRYRFIPPSQRAGSAILFVGLMGYDPNVRAAEILARKVLPIVRTYVPDATLTLAGRDPHARVRALAGKHVRVTGTVPDLRDIYDSHAVCASALDFGGGSSLKTLEALASGIPLVSTSFGVRGYDLKHQEHCLVAETPAALAQGIANVLTAREKFDSMASRAHSVAIRFDWPVLAARFGQIVDSVVRRGRTR